MENFFHVGKGFYLHSGKSHVTERERACTVREEQRSSLASCSLQGVGDAGARQHPGHTLLCWESAQTRVPVIRDLTIDFRAQFAEPAEVPADVDAVFFHRLNFGGRRSRPAADNGSRMPHAATGWSGHTGDKPDNGFAHMRCYPGGGFFFRAAANFPRP